MELNAEYYKEQLHAKEDMLARTTKFLADIHNELEEKNKILLERNEDLHSSIKFAQLIQTSLLPDINILKIFFHDAAYSVIQQIGIGGDAVVIKNTSSGVVFGLIDSTGHGIPAAMLSISTCLMLNELTTAIDVESPNNLIKLLNYQLINTFNLGEQSLAHMEGTICYYSSSLRRLFYASAKGKIMHLNKRGILSELSNDKLSVGESKHIEFSNYEIEVNSGDKLILFSDGLTDQFGGEKNKKFSKARVVSLIEKNYTKSVTQLRDIIIAAHHEWRKTNEQTDDLSLLIIQF